MSDPAAAARDFLRTPTPQGWLDRVPGRLDELLLDHANCELKAAASALALLHRYPDETVLVAKMSRLAREELRHFEQVQRLIDRYAVTRRRIGPSRYARELLAATSDRDPDRLRQRLVVGALIEARSCERFAALAPRLPPDLGRFYRELLASESRHFSDYLAIAEQLSADARGELETDIDRLLDVEAALITSPDADFRFHSGPPGIS